MVPDEITTRDVMALLDINDPATISRWVRESRLIPSRRLGTGPRAQFLFWRVEVEELAETKRAELREQLERMERAAS